MASATRKEAIYDPQSLETNKGSRKLYNNQVIKMAEEGAESANQAPFMPLSANIKEKFACLSHTPSKSCLFKIHDRLRMENKKAYEPEILSIGPYHREKKNVQAMEEHKLRYLKLLLERSEGTSVQKQEVLLQQMDEAMRDLKKKARECYADTPRTLEDDRECYVDTPRTLEDDDKFVEMMLLDGCFIIELFWRHMEGTSREGDDPIFDLVQPRGSIRRDLLLYENQLPFFILVRLVELIEPSLSQQLSEMARFFFREMDPSRQIKPSDSQSNITDMVLRLFREMLAIVRPVSESSMVVQPLISPSPEDLESSAIMPQGTDDDDNEIHLLSLIHDSWFPTLSESGSPGNESESPRNEFIKCTTELVETGIKFKQAKEYTSLLDIKFNIRNGVMKIPPLPIDDNTECLFRNLIAYEQYLWGAHSKRVTDYCIFMDRLINSAKDAQELRHRGIINNWRSANMVSHNFATQACSFSEDQFWIEELPSIFTKALFSDISMALVV
ncbi:hypothetical protein F0562_000259 [Nyssa sinensis]|uniref:Uncharacterized protein n=1 Tax=Nyssa sinensis TaxID=561372 RepID=A0A5J5C0U2_9ASTE|nr:hypothetical protein F0562_000259 [Nyssa sinensis]